jgi:DNA topoisomerase VI subunit A
MSTKGMSVTAARQLVEKLSEQGVTILVCHDFDTSGFSILHTLQSDTRRYRFNTRPKVVDAELRLADVQAMDLQSEPVEYRSYKMDPRLNLRHCGATEECNFLVRRGADGG